MAKARKFGIKGGKLGRSFATKDTEANAVGSKSFGLPSDVGHKMVKSGKASHPHWRQGKGLKHAKRMYGNADTAHAHTKVRPY